MTQHELQLPGAPLGFGAVPLPVTARAGVRPRVAGARFDALWALPRRFRHPLSGIPSHTFGVPGRDRA